MSLTSEQARMAGRIGAHTKWARTDDRTAATEAARAGLVARFEREVDPENRLDPAERSIRAEHARKAHMARLGMKSAAARKARRSP